MKKTISKVAQSKYRLLKNQLSSLVLHEKVVTTRTKASYLKSSAQKLLSEISKTKEDFELMRLLETRLYGGAVKKAFDTKGEFDSIAIYKLDRRFGDGAQKALVVLNKKTVAKKPSVADKKEAK